MSVSAAASVDTGRARLKPSGGLPSLRIRTPTSSRNRERPNRPPRHHRLTCTRSSRNGACSGKESTARELTSDSRSERWRPQPGRWFKSPSEDVLIVAVAVAVPLDRVDEEPAPREERQKPRNDLLC